MGLPAGRQGKWEKVRGLKKIYKRKGRKKM